MERGREMERGDKASDGAAAEEEKEDDTGP
jgi:hypothetical protein